MTANKGQDLPRNSSWVLHNDVASAGEVGHVVDHQGTTACGGAEGQQGIEHVLDGSVLLRDEVRWVILEVLGLPDKLGQKGHEGLLVQVAYYLLHVGGGGSHGCLRNQNISFPVGFGFRADRGGQVY